ncbi:hybrid sensor histidine kinase/response regulator [Flagellimonas allohymeniacidonis]|uniref:histidine kinase n=1 Tax=Flagellimonas allohymeniacidonis TaxID=2517819 RepID=A0A4Q8QHI5_9FLAO|nr:ATP-binding protein [Allomuricauda hymeniacidonis]TAI47899.1 response regulator [Allomuricauda hymeniacidonis]
MRPKSRKQFTLKIIAGYLAMGILSLLAGYLIYSEFEDYSTSQVKMQDNQKLLHTNLLLTELYEAENLSKLALQTRKSSELRNYSKKVDSILVIIDSLQLLTPSQSQTQRLDSVQGLLKLKVFNNAELRKLKLKTEQTAPLDSILKAINKMEIDMGRITPETFVPNFEKLSLSTQNSIREYVDILNKNIPKEANAAPNAAQVDSVLQLSKSILNRAKTESEQLERSLIQKELEIYKTDLELSQKLRSFTSAFQQELITNAYLDGFQKEKVVKRSIRFAGVAIVSGLLIAFLFTVLVSKDFLKSQRYRDQLEKEKNYSESLLKSREQLISTVSHDLRSPLGTIQGYSELLDHKIKGKKARKYVRRIKSALSYIENLANDLLDFSQLESSQLQIQKEPFLLTELLTNIAAQFEEVKVKKSVHLEFSIDSELQSAILGDSLRLRQILSNLIGNAFKFTHHGFVKIDAFVHQTVKGDYLRIKVIDTGIGIAKEKQALIFKEFAQVESNDNQKYQGYGLGLTISKKLSELMGGYLELESEEGKGSTFTVSLPLEFASVESSQALLAEQDNHSLSILILDDDRALLHLLIELCETQGVATMGYSSFKDIPLNKSLDYDIVLTDIQMNDVNGFEVLKRLKNNGFSHYSNQPIIAMTGQKNLNRSVCLDAGFTEMLVKPFSAEVLLKTLYSVSKGHRKNVSSKLAYKNTFHSNSTLFSLDLISSFLDGQPLYNVLDVFLENTKKDMYLLEKALHESEISKMESIAHRMLPMFRQLKIIEAVPLLEKMEIISKKVAIREIKGDFENLKRIISKLEDEIVQLMATHPIDTD